ncbi:unnamed protein product [Anthophora retusa]
MIPLTRLCLLGLLACSLVTADYYNVKTADKDFLARQRDILHLLQCSSRFQATKAPATDDQAWNIEANIDSYSNTAAVKEFLYMFKNGMLPRGELFSLYYPKMLEEMQALYKLFYTAKNFEVFYKTALWARNNVNEGQFFFALYNAVIRRPDTEYIQLPPPYEIYPYFFFNSEVLEKAHHVKVFGKQDSQKIGEYETYIIPANYSGWYINREYNLENKLNYFMEDIGLNSYYFFFRQGFPFWMNSEEFEQSYYRGEEYLYGHKQLMSRYYLERFANDLPKVEEFDWQQPFYAGYYPTMTYHNGLPFPQRPDWSRFPVYKYKYIREIMDKESRINAAIDSGYVLRNDSKWYNIYNEKGLNVLGNLIEGNVNSYNPKLYGSIDALGRKILGFNLEPANKYQILPSALEITSTSMRDPAFYRLYDRISSFYYRYKMQQKPYMREEVIYPNLKIESLTVDKMITYFDQFDAFINNGLLIEDPKEAESLLIKIRQYRLNHNPFNFHIALNAEKPMTVAIRIFLGPKYDSHHKLIELPENLKYFYEIDNWIIDVNAGLNKIVRNSRECFFVMPDQEPSEMVYRKILKSLESGEAYTYNERIFGFPERLLLPKGRREGMPFQLFVHVSPVSTMTKYVSRVWGNYKFDNRPYGFPLDKPFYDFKYDGPNMIFKDVLIYHKDQFDVNIAY